MCRAIGDGGRRCPCSAPENRNAQVRAKRAATKTASQTYPAEVVVENHPRDTGTQTTPVDRLAQLRQHLDDTRMLLTADTATPAEQEVVVTSLGAVIADLAYEKAGFDHTYIQSLQDNTDTLIRAADADLEAVGKRILEFAFGEGTHRSPSNMKNLRDAIRAVKDMGSEEKLTTMHDLMDIYNSAAETANQARTITPPELAHALRTLSDSYREVLAQVRELGGKQIESNNDSSKRVTKLMGAVADYYPTDWIDKSNAEGNLRFKDTKARAHYSGSAFQNKRVPLTSSRHNRHVTRPAYAIGDTQESTDYRGAPTTETCTQIVESRDGSGFVAIWEYQENEHRFGGQPRGRGWVEFKPNYWCRPATHMKIAAITAELTVDRSVTGQAFGDPGWGAGLHEFAHRCEHTNPQIGRLELAFITRRTTTPDGTQLPLQRYARDEYVRSDSFASPYIGKEYHSTRAGTSDPTKPIYTEVLSVGIEAIHSGDFGGLVGGGKFDADLDHRNFVLGMLASV